MEDIQRIEIDINLRAYLDALADTLEAFADGSVDPGDLVIMTELLDNFTDYWRGVQDRAEPEIDRVLEDLLKNPFIQAALIGIAQALREIK